MDLAEAKVATRQGAIAAVVSAVLTAIVVLVAMQKNSQEGALAGYNDPWNFVDVTLIFAFAGGVYCHSRAAAVAMLLYFFVMKAVQVAAGQTASVLLSVVFLYYFAVAVRGAFAYHRERRKEDATYRAAPRWCYWLGGLVTIPLVAVLALVLTTGLGITPSESVVSGDELDSGVAELLRENGILYDDETIELLYSYGLTTYLAGGSILSDRAVISYYEEPSGQMLIYEMAFSDIRSVTQVGQGSAIQDSVYRVEGDADDQWMEVILPSAGRADERFIAALEAKLPAAR